jgi:hypothetical protein
LITGIEHAFIPFKGQRTVAAVAGDDVAGYCGVLAGPMTGAGKEPVF